MAASPSNIQLFDLVSKISAIDIESHAISQVWLDNNQIWAPGGVTPTGEWLKHPEQLLAVEYTTPTDKTVTVVSISMTYSTGLGYSYAWGIWEVVGSSAVPLTGFVGSNDTTGVSVVQNGTLDTLPRNVHTKTWPAGARPVLAKNKTYIMGLGARYDSTRKILGSSTKNTWQIWEWSVSPTANASVSTTSSALKPTMTVVIE